MTNIVLDKAINYAIGVTEGKINTTKEVKQQCKIFLDDYERCINDLDDKYFFDMKDILVIEGILSLVRFPKGVFANQVILEHLTGFQALLVTSLFSFKYKNNPKRRKIQTMLLWIPRKNSKTFTIALIMMLLLILEEPYSTLYSVSLNSDLSGITKEMIEQLINNSDIQHHFDKNYGKIICKSTHNAMKNLISDGDKINSYDSSICVCDEIGAYEDTSLVDAIRSGALGSLNRTLFLTSTSFETDSEVFINEINYLKSVLNGDIEDENIFGLLYYADPKNWDIIEEMKKANPIVENNPSHLEYLVKECERVKQNNDGLNGFKVKNLNIWLPKDSAVSYITDEEISKPQLWIDDYDFTDKMIEIGSDYARVKDNTALSMITYDEDLEKFVIKSEVWLCEDTIDDKSIKEKIPYRRFVEEGYAKIIGTEVIENEHTIEYLDELNEKCCVNSLCYDRAHTDGWINRVGKLYNAIDIRQGFALDGAIAKLKRWILTDKVVFVKNPLVKINLKNTMLSTNRGGQCMVDKKASNGKIDITVSMLNAIAYMLSEDSRHYKDII